MNPDPNHQGWGDPVALEEWGHADLGREVSPCRDAEVGVELGASQQRQREGFAELAPREHVEPSGASPGEGAHVEGGR